MNMASSSRDCDIFLVAILAMAWTQTEAAGKDIQHLRNTRVRTQRDVIGDDNDDALQLRLPVDSKFPAKHVDGDVPHSRMRRDWSEWGNDNWSGWSNDNWSSWFDDHDDTSDWSNWSSSHIHTTHTFNALPIVMPLIIIIVVVGVLILICAKRKGWCCFPPPVYAGVSTTVVTTNMAPVPQQMALQPFPATGPTYGPPQGPIYPPPQGYLPPQQAQQYPTGVIPPPIQHPPPPPPAAQYPPVQAPPAPTGYPLNPPAAPPPAYNEAMQMSRPTSGGATAPQLSYNPNYVPATK